MTRIKSEIRRVPTNAEAALAEMFAKKQAVADPELAARRAAAFDIFKADVLPNGRNEAGNIRICAV